ncbi:ComF family protein [Marinitoga litoralis]|uniref:ComF family protein n=1 Tax=Marinitoga litoralis TaxID=570855 RepID=UPI0019606C94|nr:ComF family protein [Marinitoga litoralis]MBM7558806.1 competence protein ComFC [Marinitoga litoralis]
MPSNSIKRNINIYFSSVYEDPMSNLIKEFKFKSNINFAKIFAKLIYNTYKYYNIEFENAPEILYIPSTIDHLKNRGYNPVKLIAKELHKITGFEISNDLKINKKYSKSQIDAKNYFERKTQIKGKFKFVGSNKKNYILIDDVYTTGATVEEAINEIRGNVIPIILCKNVKNR